jgi:hypothetical protein
MLTQAQIDYLKSTGLNGISVTGSAHPTPTALTDPKLFALQLHATDPYDVIFPVLGYAQNGNPADALMIMNGIPLSALGDKFWNDWIAAHPETQKSERGKMFAEFALVAITAGALAPASEAAAAAEGTGAAVAGGGEFTAAIAPDITAGVDFAGTAADLSGGAIEAGAAGSSGAAAAAAGGSGAAITNGAAASNTAANAANAGSTAEIINGAKDSLQAAKEAVTSIVQPIADAVHSVTATVKEINDTLIQPIVAPIRQIIDSYNALHTEIARDLKSGLSGLLRIPGDVANAFDAVDTSIQRGLSQLGASMAVALGDAYTKTAPSVGALGFADLRETLTTTHKLHTTQDEQVKLVHLHAQMDVEKVAEELRAFVTWMRSHHGWWEPLTNTLASFVEGLPMWGGFLLAAMDSGKEAGRAAFQGTHLSAGDAINAHSRDILDKESLLMELRSMGYSDERISVILRLAGMQASIGDALTWWRRGLITEGLRNQLLKEQSVPENHIDLYVDASLSPPAFNDVLTELVGARMAAEGIARHALTENAPDALRAAGIRSGISPEAADAAWRAHWGGLPAASVITAYWRNLISWQQAESMLRFAGLPDELHTLFRDVLRPRIPQRALAGFVAAGVMNTGEVEQLMREEGWPEIDIARYIKLLHHNAPAATDGHVDHLHGLSLASVMALYDASTIDRTRATALLTELGVGSDAAELQLALHDTQAQIKKRELARKRIAAQARAGSLTITEAQAKLAEIGLAPGEVDDTITAIEHATTAADKQPSEGELARMLRADIISDEDYLAAIMREGFSAFWADKLLQLAKHKAAPAA